MPRLEEEKGDWGFKGLKQAIKLEFALGRYEDAVKHYKELLTYVKSRCDTELFGEINQQHA